MHTVTYLAGGVRPTRGLRRAWITSVRDNWNTTRADVVSLEGGKGWRGEGSNSKLQLPGCVVLPCRRKGYCSGRGRVVWAFRIHVSFHLEWDVCCAVTLYGEGKQAGLLKRELLQFDPPPSLLIFSLQNVAWYINTGRCNFTCRFVWM